MRQFKHSDILESWDRLEWAGLVGTCLTSQIYSQLFYEIDAVSNQEYSRSQHSSQHSGILVHGTG